MPWSGWLGYAWSRVEDRVDGQAVRRSWDQRHTLNGGIGWTGAHWQATLAAQYHTGWPVTPVSVDPTGTSVVIGGRNTERYADYAHRGFSRQPGVGRCDTVRSRCTRKPTNALDRRNPCCTDFEFDENPDGTLDIERDLRHWLPLVPSVGVLWKF